MSSTSLVVRARNEAAHIGNLLRLTAEQVRPVDEIVVVDSGSTDDTVRIALDAGASVIHIDQSEFSFGRSLNRGIDASRGDVIVIASAHTMPVDRHWIERLITPLEDASYALTYGRQVGGATTAFSEHQIFRKWFPDRSDPDQRHPFCNNANAAIRRTAWESLRYDESLTGLEDLDWARRALDRGHRIAYVADAAVHHLHDESPSQVARRYEREAIAHRVIIGDQRMTRAEAITLGFANVGVDLAAAARRGKLGVVPSILQFRSAQFLGTYRGFREADDVTDILKRRFYYPDLGSRGRR